MGYEDSAVDFLMGGGVKGARFPDQQFGTKVGGRIVREPELRQQTDFDSGEPKFYEDGGKMMQLVVQVQTDLRDPADPEDDGVRAFYIKNQMREAVQKAVRQARAKKLEVDGELYITYVRDEPNKRGRGKPKKVYVAEYQQPASGQEAFLADASGSEPQRVAEVVPEVLDRMRRAHASSPILNRSRAAAAPAPNPGFQDEVPF